MQKGNSARRFVSLSVALVALVALTVSLGAGAASAGPGHAVTSKKKCKKAKKRAASAKKKKCKHRKHATVVPPATTPPTTPSSPTTRASITWDTNDEIDLHTYDASGDHSGFAGPPAGGFVQGIPDAQATNQSTPGGPETFVDNESPSTRTFTFYVCLFGYAGADGADVHVTADITDPGGGHRSIPVTLNGIGDDALVTVSPGGGSAYPAPPGYCGLAG